MCGAGPVRVRSRSCGQFFMYMVAVLLEIKKWSRTPTIYTTALNLYSEDLVYLTLQNGALCIVSGSACFTAYDLLGYCRLGALYVLESEIEL